MTKKNVIIAIVILLALIGGVILWNQKNSKQDIAKPKQQQVTKQTQEQKTTKEQIIQKEDDNNQKQIDGELIQEERIDTSDWKTYRNEEYGFEMKLPGNIEKWNIKEKKILKINSFYNSNNEKYLDFAYVLDNSILKDENNSSLGFNTEMSLWYISIVPVNDYIKNACEKYKKPMCRQGAVLGQNDKFVFIAGFSNIEGAGYLCNNKYDEQKEFCTVDSYFGLKNINNLINFKVL